MALDGIMLRSLTKELKILENGKISKISQVGNSDFLFVVRSNNQNHNLFISLERNSYRICLTDKEYLKPKDATMFTMFLRKHLEGGIIKEISQYDLDRIITINLSKINEFGDNKNKKIIIELMGKNSNLIITDKENIIIDSLRRIGVTENGRTIVPHATYNYPEITKVNVFTASEETIKETYEKVSDYRDIVSLFSGVSPLLAKYIYNHKAPLYFLTTLKDLEIIPNTFLNNDKLDFYCYEIANIKEKYLTLSELLENYFYQKTIYLEAQEKSNNLATTIKHTLTKLENKILKLEEELKTALNSYKYQNYGDLIMANLYQLKDTNQTEITLFDYVSNENVKIPLDNKLSLKGNALKFYQKYQKSKKATTYIEEQIKIAKEEIKYLELILIQIKTANVKDIEEIKDELIKNHYLKATSNSKKRKEKVEIIPYETSEGTLIYVGKNNLQNEYLTHSFANSNDTWMHVKDAPGSHVIIHKAMPLSEEDIRTGAILAAYFSKYQDSSSVAVDYTLVRNVKKIPGQRACFVTYKNQKTIYIDPEIEIINKLKKKKISEK